MCVVDQDDRGVGFGGSLGKGREVGAPTTLVFPVAVACA